MTVVAWWPWLTRVQVLMGEYTMSNSVRSSEVSSSRSQFYLTFKAAPHLDKKHTVFGKLVGGEEVLDALERLPRKDGTDRPLKPVRITEVVMCVRKSFALRSRN